jgi:hypothetical protein
MLIGRVYTVYNHLVKPYVSDLPGAFWVNRQLSKVNNLFVESPEGDVLRAVEGNWDVLIVLDACRYDYYSDFFPEAGKRVSKASHSREYFQQNYSEGSFDDVIYVSANPHFLRVTLEILQGEILGRSSIKFTI